MIIKQLTVPPIGTNCYLIGDERTHAGAVIDPGGDAERILAAAREAGLELRLVFLTHGHFDHTGAVDALCAALPDLVVYLHPEDRAALGDQIMPALAAPLQAYGDGDCIPLGDRSVEVLHTPGHTPGGVTLRVDGALFTGDTLFRGSMGRTDLPGGSYEVLMASLRRLGGLPGDYAVYPGHEGSSTLDGERRENYYLREAMG